MSSSECFWLNRVRWKWATMNKFICSNWNLTAAALAPPWINHVAPTPTQTHIYLHFMCNWRHSALWESRIGIRFHRKVFWLICVRSSLICVRCLHCRIRLFQYFYLATTHFSIIRNFFNFCVNKFCTISTIKIALLYYTMETV